MTHKWKRPNRSEAHYCPALVRWVRERCGMRPADSILDVGCGDGKWVREFRAQGGHATGVDWIPAEGMITGDIESVNWWGMMFENAYDYAFCKSVLEHVHDPELLILRIARVLKSGGHVITITPDWRWCYRGFYSAWDHIRPLAQPAIEEMMERVGLEVVDSIVIRPSRQIMGHWRTRWLYTVITALLPYRWAGSWKYGKRGHKMAYVVGRKP